MKHYSCLLTPEAHKKSSDHLLNQYRLGKKQEELCFALWRPSSGRTRFTAIIYEIILPEEGERNLHGNVSFEPSYLSRAVKFAYRKGVGLAIMHNHLAEGWQQLSLPDIIAERDRIAPATRITKLPLVGLTLGIDEIWSARYWQRKKEEFECNWCRDVRVIGNRIHKSTNCIDSYQRREKLKRTIDSWGIKCQSQLADMHVGIVGLGSVGAIVAESLARIGVEKLTLIDFDQVETHNLDRLLFATEKDVGRLKVHLSEQNIKKSSTAANFRVLSVPHPIQNPNALNYALDCDVLFSAVDRPLPKDLLNHIAYAHCIPVISGGVFIDNKEDGSLGQAAWAVTTVGPSLRCLRCDGQYTSSEVVLDYDGSLDDPTYVPNTSIVENVQRNQNVFPFSASLGSSMVVEFIRLVIIAKWWPHKVGRSHYSMIPNRLAVEKLPCNENCSVKAKIALGDKFNFPFLQMIDEIDDNLDAHSLKQPPFYIRSKVIFYHIIKYIRRLLQRKP